MRTSERKRPASKKPSPRLAAPDLIDSLVDALSVISTGVNSMVRCQDQEGTARRDDVCEEITTLQHGVKLLRKSVEDIQVVLK